MMSRQERQQIELLYQNNAFGDISGWLSLNPQELKEECLNLINHWTSVLHWDLRMVTTDGIVKYLEEKWVEQTV